MCSKWVVRPRGYNVRKIGILRPDRSGHVPRRICDLFDNSVRPCGRIPSFVADADRECLNQFLGARMKKVETHLRQIDNNPPPVLNVWKNPFSRDYSHDSNTRDKFIDPTIYCCNLVVPNVKTPGQFNERITLFDGVDFAYSSYILPKGKFSPIGMQIKSRHPDEGETSRRS